KLTAFLWADRSTEAARHSLEQLLYSVRRELRADLFAGTDPIRLNGTTITSDVAAFEDALARGSDAEFVAEYRGPFLDGFFLTGADEFERWAEDERSRLRVLYAAALERVAERASLRRDWTGAVDTWRRLTALDRLSAKYATGLVRAIAAA